jgi:hypothetical protein
MEAFAVGLLSVFDKEAGRPPEEPIGRKANLKWYCIVTSSTVL